MVDKAAAISYWLDRAEQHSRQPNTTLFTPDTQRHCACPGQVEKNHYPATASGDCACLAECKDCKNGPSSPKIHTRLDMYFEALLLNPRSFSVLVQIGNDMNRESHIRLPSRLYDSLKEAVPDPKKWLVSGVSLPDICPDLSRKNIYLLALNLGLMAPTANSLGEATVVSYLGMKIYGVKLQRFHDAFFSLNYVCNVGEKIVIGNQVFFAADHCLTDELISSYAVNENRITSQCGGGSNDNDNAAGGLDSVLNRFPQASPIVEKTISCLRAAKTNKWITPAIIAGFKASASSVSASGEVVTSYRKAITAHVTKSLPLDGLFDLEQPTEHQLIYAAIALMEYDRFDAVNDRMMATNPPPAEESAALLAAIKHEFDLCNETPSPWRYLAEAEALLIRYRDGIDNNYYQTVNDEGLRSFDYFYFFACHLLERRLGLQFSSVDLKDEKSGWLLLKNVFNPNTSCEDYKPLCFRELNFLDLFKSLSSPSASSAHTRGIKTRGSTTGVTGADVSTKSKFTSCAGEWEYMKTKLSEDDKRSFQVLDKIMAFQGLEKMKRELLNLYKRVQFHGDHGQGENFHFILAGNPGTGKTTFGRLIGELLMQLNIRPFKDFKMKKKAAEATVREKQLDERDKKQQQDVTNFDLLLASARYNTLNAFLPSVQGVANAANSTMLSCADVVAAPSYQSQLNHHKAQVDFFHQHCKGMSKSYEDEVTTLKVAWEMEKVNLIQKQKAHADAVAATKAAQANVPKVSFLETSGGELAHKGVDHITNMVDSLLSAEPPGGVIFIDEAGQLAHPKVDGLKIIHYLLTVCENHKDKLSVILCGYPSQIKALKDMDNGLASRFPNEIIFEDYGAVELGKIFQSQIDVMHTSLRPWKLQQEIMAEVVGRRIARSAGVEGFGNARDVLNVVKVVKERYYERCEDGGDFVLSCIDVLGKQPDPSKSIAFQKILKMIGQKRIKSEVHNLLTLLNEVWESEQRGEEPPGIPLLNCAFVGSPGTGKTTVGKLYGELLKETGFLTKGNLVDTKPSDFIGVNRADTITKTKGIMSQAKGNVLLIDEAYGLDQDAVNTIVELAPAKAGADMVLIILGYKDDIDDLLKKSNPGLSSRFPNKWEFESYNEDELMKICHMMGKERKLTIPFAVQRQVARYLALQSKLRTFGNAREVDTLISKLESIAQKRVSGSLSKTIILADFEEAVKDKNDDVEDAFPMPPALKKAIQMMAANQMMRQIRKEGEPEIQHMIFTGNAGVGKTHAARKMAKQIKKLGLLPSDQVHECNADSLVGEFVGQTQSKVTQLLKDSEGGVLFVDEAHRLNPKSGADSFKQEALGVIMKALEPHGPFYNKILIIFAGYGPDMNELLNADQGLARRFKCRVHIEDILPSDALKLMLSKLNKDGYTLFAGGEVAAKKLFDALYEREGWSNIADVNTVCQELSIAAAARLQTPLFEALESDHALSPEEHVELEEGLRNWKKNFTAEDMQFVHELMLSRRQVVRTVNGHRKKAPAPTDTDHLYQHQTRSHQKQQNSAPMKTDDKEDEDDVKDDFNADKHEDDVMGGGGDGGGLGDMTATIDALRNITKAGEELSKRLNEPDHMKGIKDLLQSSVEGKQLLSMITGQTSPDANSIDSVLKTIRDKLNEYESVCKRRHEEARDCARAMNRDMSNLEEGIKNCVERRKTEQSEQLKIELEREIARQQEALAAMKENQLKAAFVGKCPAGYGWSKCDGGYRCDGGSHYLSDAEISGMLS